MSNLLLSMYQDLPGSLAWHFSDHQIHRFVICVFSLKMLLSKNVAFYVYCVNCKVCFYKKFLEPRIWKSRYHFVKDKHDTMKNVSFGLPAVDLNHHVYITSFDIPSNLQYKTYQIAKLTCVLFCLAVVFCPMHWSQVSCRECRFIWSSADRRCSNYIWVINKCITCWGSLKLEVWR